MSWVLLALGAAVFYALQGAWTKHIGSRASGSAATWAIFAFAFPVLFIYLALQGPPAAIGDRFWPAVVVNVVLSCFSFSLYVSALNRGDIGLTYPLLALTPIFLVPVEWLLLRDAPGAGGLAGVCLVVAGVYLLGYDPSRADLFGPLRAVARDPGARRMLGVALIWAVSGTVDRVAVLDSSPALYGTVLTGAIGVAFLPLVSRRGGGLRNAMRPEARWLLVVQGLLFAAMFMCQMEALGRSLAANVITIKRSGAMLTVLLGTFFFSERFAASRLAGTLVILAGVFLVARG
ncbi:MAG: DMT family transporter [Gemmatimonadota bacterium]